MSEIDAIARPYSDARWCASPNYNQRPDHCAIDLIVVHNISLPPGRFGTGDIQALFCNTLDCTRDPFYRDLEGLEVSSHFLIDREGGATQFVACDDRAWHAGVSNWCGRSNCNDFSIGIELEGTDHIAYAPPQYLTLVRIIRALRKEIPSLRQGAIVGHSDIAPGRKSDPGESFDWAHLRALLRSSS